MSDNRTLSFAEFRARVSEQRGKEYWRSLEELARTDDFDEFFAEEFPQQALPLAKGVDRRSFMKLMGASVAMAGLAACKQPAESIVPYVRQPEDLIPGKPLFFATAMTLGGYATGVLAESHMGRPTKIEGNPDHPTSFGATDSYMQASILGLYDPDRSQVVRRIGEISTWSDFIGAIQPILRGAAANGSGLRILSQTITSPTLGAQLAQLMRQYPGMKWHQWEAVNRDNIREGARQAFGSYVQPTYHFEKADVVVAISSDFLGEGVGHLRHVRDFMSRRKVRTGSTSMNRLYTIEATPSMTGSVSDHRLPVRPSQIEAHARAIAAGLGLGADGAASDNAAWIGAVVRDLQASRGKSIVIAGDDQPPVVHAIAHAINQSLGNIGSTVMVIDSPEVNPINQLESFRELVTDMNAGTVRGLIILGGNPVFDAPSDFRFADALQKVPFRAHLSPYYDETSMLVHWHIPETHYLETWGDARALDGTVSIQQPLIAPLYNGRSAIEVLGALIGGLDQSPYEAVRSYWMARSGAGLGFENSWKKWLNDGSVAGTASPERTAAASTSIAASQQKPATGIELELKHDPTVYDGRFANNGWLQELPKPITKITWDNALLVGPKTAEKLGIEPSEDMVNEKQTFLVEVSYRGKTIELPVWVVPGMPDDTATVYFGYGRTHGGRLSDEVGFDTYPIRFSDAMYGGSGAQLKRTLKGFRLACTQEHQNIDPKIVGERGLVREGSFTEWQKNPSLVEAKHDSEDDPDASMWPKYDYSKGHAWGMVIDTSVCTGCNGCVIACQSENNISIVGKEEVIREREMHWLRIDRYYKGTPENPEVYNQPVPCMHCENAPCEPVCPVEATSHSPEGINEMTYNRCVGTRYCSNNCPYKVRRFNFFHYADYDTPSLKPMRNPDVTVRTRGVMEKCTFCVQRVNNAKITAEKENRRVRDGELVTACQQACPSQAIVFGDLNDPTSVVAQLKKEPTNYGLLEELNTRPRTTYLATVRNPNPEIKTI